MTIYFKKQGAGMGTFIEIILLILLIATIGLILGYLFGMFTCKKESNSKIIQKGKICEERAKVTQDQSDLLEKESKELIESSNKEALLTNEDKKKDNTLVKETQEKVSLQTKSDTTKIEVKKNETKELKESVKRVDSPIQEDIKTTASKEKELKKEEKEPKNKTPQPLLDKKALESSEKSSSEKGELTKKIEKNETSKKESKKSEKEAENKTPTSLLNKEAVVSTQTPEVDKSEKKESKEKTDSTPSNLTSSSNKAISEAKKEDKASTKEIKLNTSASITKESLNESSNKESKEDKKLKKAQKNIPLSQLYNKSLAKEEILNSVKKVINPKESIKPKIKEQKEVQNSTNKENKESQSALKTTPSNPNKNLNLSKETQATTLTTEAKLLESKSSKFPVSSSTHLPIATKEANEIESVRNKINSLDKPKNNKPDNLKKIKGIGVVIEKKLHKLGIFHFEQIAAWTQEEIEVVDQHLSFKGRIIREKWIEQAKILAMRKRASK